MHRRARHLNFKAAGSDAYFDARRISGTSDGTAIGTWSDSSGSSNDMTQATTANKPTYKTGIIGGQPVLRFASASPSYVINSAYAVTANTTSVFFVGQTSSTVTTSGRFVSMNRNAANDYAGTDGWLTTYFDGSADRFASYRNGSLIMRSDVVSRSTPYIVDIIMNSTAVDIYVNSTKTSGTTSATAMNSNHLLFGTNENGQDAPNLNGDIGMVSIIKSVVGNPLRKRLEHSMGFSFKIKTN